MFFAFPSAPRRSLGILALSAGLALNSGCVAAISTQQEVQLGDQYAAELARQLPLVRDASIESYINQLGNTLARRADPRGIRYTFYVVNAPEVNAFAVPGGHVYINRGLIERASTLSELAGVLAHEVGHVVHRHGVEQMERAQNANLGLSLVYGILLGRSPSGLEQIGTQVIGSAVFAGFSREAEREADASAIEYLVASGINPEGMVTMFQTLLREHQRNPSSLEQWFSTHPTTQERIDNVQRMINTIPVSDRRVLTTNDQAYIDFRNRVARLPAAGR